jgi:hypothetical protein
VCVISGEEFLDVATTTTKMGEPVALYEVKMKGTVN